MSPEGGQVDSDKLEVESNIFKISYMYDRLSIIANMHREWVPQRQQTQTCSKHFPCVPLFLFSVYYIRPLKMFLTKLTIRKGTCCAQKEVVTATPEISQHIYVTSIFGKKPCWCVSQEISKGESYKKWENWFNHWLLLVLEHPITRKISSNFVWGVDSCQVINLNDVHCFRRFVLSISLFCP